MTELTMQKIAAPHAHDRSSVERIMMQVCIALAPCTVLGIYLFGFPALWVLITSCVSAVGTEALCLKAMRVPLSRLRDSSALLTGWLLALSLPPWSPWWIAAGGAAFAIAIGKQLYGGIGQNIFNPAMLARVALLISFPVQMTTWVDVTPIISPQAPDLIDSFKIIFGHVNFDGMTGATELGRIRTGLTQHQTVPDMIAQGVPLSTAIFGFTRGSLGETSELLVLLGGLWLLYLRIISWHIPVAMLSALALLAGVAHWLDPIHYAPAIFHLTSGGIMLGAFFIATDLVTSPVSGTGKILFGAGCGLVLFVIRTWASFPEGVAFAVLFMNALTPLIDYYFKPRIFGRDGRGKPLPIPSSRSGSST